MILRMSKSNSAIVWGKTLAATGGTLGLLVSLLLWFGGFGRVGPQETIYLASLTFGSLIPITGALVPRVESRVQGGIILAASLMILSIWSYYGFSGRLQLVTVASAILFISWAIIVLVGAILLLLPGTVQRLV